MVDLSSSVDHGASSRLLVFSFLGECCRNGCFPASSLDPTKLTHRTVSSQYLLLSSAESVAAQKRRPVTICGWPHCTPLRVTRVSFVRPYLRLGGMTKQPNQTRLRSNLCRDSNAARSRRKESPLGHQIARSPSVQRWGVCPRHGAFPGDTSDSRSVTCCLNNPHTARRPLLIKIYRSGSTHLHRVLGPPLRSKNSSPKGFPVNGRAYPTSWRVPLGRI
ncbi:hypothetical protein EDB83DRAFT_1564602 [Lactarius deliciosus]|nr:hypothetical protein EDB83DRAFT_1564602 [Lactarius deliciosus]